MESFYWKNLRKPLNESAICQNQQNQHRLNASFTFQSKKVKEALRKRLSGNKITWTETFVRSKKFAKWKTTLNRGTLAYYENLQKKPSFLKKVQSFLRVTAIPLPPKSVTWGVYTAFPQITQKILPSYKSKLILTDV